MGKKRTIVEVIYNYCKKKNNYIFDNNLVKKIVSDVYPKTNPYDMTKISKSSELPDVLLEDDIFIAHIGNGKHKFIKGINRVFHQFEEINENEIIIWPYRPSIINDFSDTESNVLSLCYNHRIIHDFLYLDISASPKVYISERKRGLTFKYKIGSNSAINENLQIEIDLITEYLNEVTVYEGKKAPKTKWNKDFNVFQLYNPYRFFYDKKKNLKIDKLSACYLVRQKKNDISYIRLYKYTFSNPSDISSIKLLKKREYRIKRRGFDE